MVIRLCRKLTVVCRLNSTMEVSEINTNPLGLMPRFGVKNHPRFIKLTATNDLLPPS